ncbi:MAG: sorbosone dehydrogenase [Gemmataceae bacterium]|nr:sorbosone dehydrogenase [Gemmataceae bacterium]
MHRYLPAVLLALCPSVAFAQQNAKIPDPDPELERKTFIVAPGFEVSLYAADPLLAKPIQMNFDPRGRLWVASSEVYPQIKPGEKANDKIIVLEDTDGDGKADKTTVFADGLLIPTGIEPGDGGAYVANSTEVVHLSASKPGGKADRTRVLLSGFGTEDTHHIIHTFRWGPDCNLYFNQSIYIHSHIETPNGVKRLNAGGIWRFRPETFDLDVFARGWVNSWGHSFDRWGQSFVTDGAGGEGINHAIPGAYFMTSQGPHVARILHGLNPGSPKHCGLEIVSGRHFPADWQGDLITNDFRGHRVCRFKLQDDGSTYASREQVEVIKSDHPAFRPIDVKMGPDGALYIADWYNPIIQHGEVDFRDPRRDKTHGRIWRVTAKGRPLVARPKLVDATVPELLDRLKDPEDWTRQQAKRVLKERGWEKVRPELAKWVEALKPTEPDYENDLLEAAWVNAANRVFDIDISKKLLRAKNPGVRAAGVRLLSEQPLMCSKEDWPALLADPNPRVRLEAVRTLAEVPNASLQWGTGKGVAKQHSLWATEIVLSVLDQPMDRVLDYALWLTVRELEPYWMPAFKEGKLTFGGDSKKLAFALSAVGTKDAVAPVLKLAENEKIPVEQRKQLWLLLAHIGGPNEVPKVLVSGHDPGDEMYLLAVLQALIENTRQRHTLPSPTQQEGDLAGILYDYSHTGGQATRIAAVRLSGLWKLEHSRGLLEERAVNAKRTAEDRKSAIDALADLGGPQSLTYLKSLSTAKYPAETRRQAISALTNLSLPDASTAATEYLSNADAKDDLADLYAAFLNRKGGAAALAKALDGKKLNPDVAKLGLRAVRAAVATDSGPLADALTKAGGLGAAKKEATPEEVKALVADVAAIGDPVRGEAVFRRKDLQCLACHGTGGAGGQVGPDLTSIGASAQPDYLVESLLLPNKAVKEGYHAVRVVTADDRVHIGIKVRETNGQFVLRTPEDKEVVVPVADIIERGNAKSLMPDGLTDPLTRQEFADLVRFLSELGKVGPYAPTKARVVRRWQLIEGTPANMDLARRTRLTAAAEPGNAFAWSPLYARVSGDLLLADLPKLVIWNDTAPLAVVRFQLDVTAGGPAKLKFNSPVGLTLYAGAAPVEVKAETVIDLKPGVQTLSLVVDRSKRTEDVRVELDDVPGSPARVSVVGGK